MTTSIGSRTVDFYRVHEYVTRVLDAVGSWPMAGTLDWQRLDDDDPAKLAALLDAAQHHVLRVETAQAALADASKEISAAADCTSIARRIHAGRGTAYVPRKQAS